MIRTLTGADIYVCPECGSLQYEKVRNDRPRDCPACEYEVLCPSHDRFEKLDI